MQTLYWIVEYSTQRKQAPFSHTQLLSHPLTSPFPKLLSADTGTHKEQDNDNLDCLSPERLVFALSWVPLVHYPD